MDSSKDRLFDLYLDEVLNGDPLEPESFCARHGVDVAFADELRRVWKMAQPASGTPSSEPVPLLEVEGPLPFERLGEYRLLRLLGEGGMGKIYLAQQDGLGRLCAIKVIRQELATSSSIALRFEREARIVAELRHPGIASVFGFGSEQGVTYFAMEWIPGENLSDSIAHLESGAESTPRDARRTIEWGLQIADALDYAHRQGVLHRDVKPDNIRLSPDGRATLIDFGVARQRGTETLTSAGGFAGTPTYASPEQVSGADDIDARTDVYSLGATLYEALTGTPAFKGDHMAEVVDRVLHSEPTPPSDLGAKIPRDLECVLMKALEKDRSRRYDSAAAFADDLRAVLEVRPVAARPVGVLRRSWRWCRRNRFQSAGLAGLFLLVIVGAGIQSYIRADALRMDRAEARQLIERAGSVIGSYEAGRHRFERARAQLRGYRFRREEHWIDPEFEQGLSTAAVDLEEYQAIQLQLSRAPEWLSQARRLDPEADGIEDAWAAYYYQKWLDVRDEPEAQEASYYRERAIEHDATGKWTELLAGHARLTLKADPDGSEIHVFRYVSVQDGPAVRSIPTPLHGPVPTEPVWALTVLATSADGLLQPGDLVQSVANGPVRGRTFVARQSAGLVPGARLVAIDGRRLIDHGAPPSVPPDRTHTFQFELPDGTDVERHGTSLVELGIELANAEELVRRGGVNVERFRRGRSEDIVIGPGAVTQLTAAPLFIGPESLVGASPATFESQDPGWYIAYFEAPDREPLRVSFHVDHACEVYFKPEGVELDPRLLPAGSSPPGYVFLPIEALPGHDMAYWMKTTEVTAGEYLAFLNSSEILPRALGGEPLLIPIDPRAESGKAPWPVTEGRVDLPAGMPHDWPVLGVSWVGADAYAAWCSEEPDAVARGIEYSLPTRIEWRWAAFGGDSRTMAFGDDYVPHWLKGRYSRPDVMPEPIRSYPIDESPFGVFDLAGSAREWCVDGEQASGGAVRYLAGGCWLDSQLTDFQIRSTRTAQVSTRDPAVGFRLVAREKNTEPTVGARDQD